MVGVPDPKPGRVIRYQYLWRRRARRGHETADKDRPACILIALRKEEGDTRVLIVPITHSPPARGELAYEMPPRLKAHLRLDEERSWIILSEANIDIWPSPDLCRIPGRSDAMDYGLLPQKLVNHLRQVIVAAVLENRLEATDREAADPMSKAKLSPFASDHGTKAP